MSTPYDPTADNALDSRTERTTFIDVRTRDDNGRFKPKQIESPAPNKAQHSPLTLCQDVRYQDGDTLSVSSVKGKPRETICILLDYKRKSARADKLAAGLRQVKAALSQPVQFNTLAAGHGGALTIIKGDCEVARKMIDAALKDYEAAQ